MKRCRGARAPRLWRSIAWRRIARHLSAGRVACGVVLATSVSIAQTAEDPSSNANTETIAPPELVEFVEASYPPEAREAGVQAVVPLELDLDASGQVQEARVLEPQGHGFDEAAREAALRFQFKPALREGVAVPARIRYQYAFQLAAEHLEPATPGESEPAPPKDPEPPKLVPIAIAPVAQTPTPAETVEVEVRGDSAEDRRRRSAEAVDVIDTERDRRASADLGEVLRRQSGVSVRRAGGLGSNTRIALNGLTDDHIRFFVDEAPLEFMGFGLGVGNVPVNLVDRVEIYRGVVPVRFGADTLGGAVNFVTDSAYDRTRAALSHQLGSFGTHRLAANVRGRSEWTGLVAGAAGFVDYAENDYRVDIEMADERGQKYPETVTRFHDAYKAGGGSVEFGVVGKPWANKLLVRLFGTYFRKDLQNNFAMTVPYGEVEYGETAYGAIARYSKGDLLVPGLHFAASVGYSQRNIEFLDVSPWVYDWRGHRIFERPTQVRPPGELGPATDSVFWERSGMARFGFTYFLGDQHAFTAAISPTLIRRTGEDRLWESDRLDPLSSKNSLLTLISGLEYKLEAFDRVENIALIKHYLYDPSVEQVDDMTDTYTSLGSSTRILGFGDGLRVYLLRNRLWSKVSYEYGARLPRSDEVFGNGGTIIPNLELSPERSHNANLGIAGQSAETTVGSFRGEVEGFYRSIQDLILLLPLGDPAYSQSINISNVRSRGVEGSLGWTSPGEFFSLDGNVTWIDLRNTSTEGPFAQFEGDRVPNRPWLMANGQARLAMTSPVDETHELSLSWYTNYVHDFWLSWESAGQRNTKASIPSQLLHSIALNYLVKSWMNVSSTFEVQNLADAKAYDFYGVQKPGRAYYFKGSLEY